MHMALYEPGLGYYSAGAGKFGGAGDFITAPELSPLFAACLARQCAQILPKLNDPVILEIGPGSGALACDLLKSLEQQAVLPERYFLLEVSADLRQRQQQRVRKTIPHLADRITWLDQLPGDSFDGIILGNEVLDAMPVHRLILKDGRFQELCVELDGENFNWTVRALPAVLQSQVETVTADFVSALPEGYLTEINPHNGPWIKSLADGLRHGVMLFIDYGYPRHEYYHPQRTCGTLLCHYRHHVHDDPFLYPGLQDITASVDFTAVAEVAVAAGLDVRGYTTQAHFLLDCGLDKVMEENNLTSNRDRAELGRQARILTMPGEMGERFKVIALAKNFDLPLAGFQHFDQRQRL